MRAFNGTNGLIGKDRWYHWENLERTQYIMDRNGHWPKWLWTEMVMGRNGAET